MPNKKTTRTGLLIALYPKNQDLARTWFIGITTPPPHGKYIKLYGVLNKLPTVKERIAYYKQLKEKILANPEQYLPTTRPDITTGYTEKLWQTAAGQIIQQHLQRLRPKSQSTYKTKWRNFCKWAKKNDVATLKLAAPDAQNFIAYLQAKTKLSNTTINAYRNTLKTIYNWLGSQTRKKNPFLSTKKLPEFRRGLVAFKPAQVAQLKQAIIAQSPQLWLACQLQYYCFIRPGNELRNLQIQHIDLENNTILIPATASKNKKEQHIIIPNALAQTLQQMNLHQYPPTFYLLGKGGLPAKTRHRADHYRTRHNDILRELGYSSRYSFYSWKHTGVVALYKSGAGLVEIQCQLRHSDLKTVQIYLQSLGLIDCENVRNFPEI